MTAPKKQQQSPQQSQSETFQDPNADYVSNQEVNEKGLDQDEANVHNAEQANPNEFVRVSSVVLPEDVDPLPQGLSAEERQRILGYNQMQFQVDLDKAQYQKLGFVDWQSKQLYYTVFLKKGVDVNTKEVEYERREYRYHMLSTNQKKDVMKLSGELETLKNSWNMFNRGVVSESLFLFIFNQQIPIKQRIEELEIEVLDKKFSAYFLEDDQTVLGEMLYPDKQMMVAAAEKREAGVTFLQKRDSSPTTSGSNKAVKVVQKSGRN